MANTLLPQGGKSKKPKTIISNWIARNDGGPYTRPVYGNLVVNVEDYKSVTLNSVSVWNGYDGVTSYINLNGGRLLSADGFNTSSIGQYVIDTSSMSTLTVDSYGLAEGDHGSGASIGSIVGNP